MGFVGVFFFFIVVSSLKDKEVDFVGFYGVNICDNINIVILICNISLVDIDKVRISILKRDEYEESEEEIEEFEYEWGSGVQFKGRLDLVLGFVLGSVKKKILVFFFCELNFFCVGGKDREMDDEWIEMVLKKKIKGKRKEVVEYVWILKF